MHGKILKVKNNDLDKLDDTCLIAVYACFRDKKYSDKYVIFSYINKYRENTLYYGSIFNNSSSLVILESKKNIEKDILNIANNLLNNKWNDYYEILTLENITKAEVVSSNKVTFNEDNLIKLQNKTIKIEVPKDSDKKNKGGWLIVILMLLIIVSVGIFIYVITRYDYTLYCENNYSNEEVSANVNDVVTVYFNKDNSVKYLKKIVKYKFDTKIEYREFKSDKSLQSKIIESADAIKEEDDENTLVAITNKYNLTNSFDSFKDMYEAAGYTCKKVKDE